MSVRVYVGMGSNQDRDNKIRSAVAELRAHFGNVDLSPIYESAAVGFDGSDFLNLVAGFDTDLSLPAVITRFRNIEDGLGRVRRAKKFASRPIDLDILLYGDTVTEGYGIRIPREEILENAYVLKPLQDLVPDGLHPEAGETYAALWQRMASRAPRLDLYPLDV